MGKGVQGQPPQTGSRWITQAKGDIAVGQLMQHHCG